MDPFETITSADFEAVTPAETVGKPTTIAAPATPEKRIKLSATQLQMIGQTQAALTVARTQLAERDREAKQVLALVFDAHGIDPAAQVALDEQTGELVIAG